MTVEQINDRLVSKLVNNELVILPFGDFQVSYFVTNWSFLGRTVIQLLNCVNHKNRNISYYSFYSLQFPQITQAKHLTVKEKLVVELEDKLYDGA